MRFWRTLADACWIERATKQAPAFITMKGTTDGGALILRPTSPRSYREIDEDWEGTTVFWPPPTEPNPWAGHSDGWSEGTVAAVDGVGEEGAAPTILVRTDQAVDRATISAFERGHNVGHREFDFYAPLTAWADEWVVSAPAETPDTWLQGRTAEVIRPPCGSTEGLDADKVAALGVQRRRLGVLWGPPGTGKTFAVGQLVARRMQAEPTLRVLVLSISNRAVDIAALSVDDAWAQRFPHAYPPDAHTLVRARAPAHARMLKPERGHLLRGYTETVEPFKRRRAELLERLLELPNRPANAPQRLALREELKANIDGMNAALRGLLLRARCVFATVNHAVHSSSLDIGAFGLVIVDEAGFVPAASLASVAASCTGAMVVAGDFQQLPPIVNFNPQPARGRGRRHWPTRYFEGHEFAWLDDEDERAEQHRRVYSWFGETVYDMLAVADREIGRDADAAAARGRAAAAGWFVMLSDQRRMPEVVCRFVARQVYGGPGALRTVAGGEHRTFLEAIDGVQHPLLWLNVEGHTATGPASQLFHDQTARVAVDLALRGARAGGRVHILTRYSAQAKHHRRCIEELRPHHGDEVVDRITASTVHRAQGDEADLVIFDPIHTLPWFVTGATGWRDEMRLCNVIVSRTKGQVVAFLHPSFLPQHPYWQAYCTEANELRVPGFASR